MVSLFSQKINAQEVEERKNVIKVNYLSPILSTLSLFYERTIAPKTSLQLGLAYTSASIGSGDSKTTLSGFAITPEVRFYFSEKGAPRGFFIAPFLRNQNFTLKSTGTAFSGVNIDYKATYTSFGGGAVIGGQWLFGGRVSLDVWGGPSYNAGTFKYEGGATESNFTISGFNGFGFRFGSTIGVAF